MNPTPRPEPEWHDWTYSCWLCKSPPVHQDFFGIGWCQLHIDRAQGLEDRHAPWD